MLLAKCLFQIDPLWTYILNTEINYLHSSKIHLNSCLTLFMTLGNGRDYLGAEVSTQIHLHIGTGMTCTCFHEAKSYSHTDNPNLRSLPEIFLGKHRSADVIQAFRFQCSELWPAGLALQSSDSLHLCLLPGRTKSQSIWSADHHQNRG